MKIVIITGSRAEWGLLQPLAKLMHEDKDIDFKLMVCGSHLSHQLYQKRH
jgi:UDP-N-acetylglucosamine 2-epimerase